MSLILSIVTKLSKLSTSSATLSCEQQTTTKMHNKNRPRLNRSTMFVVGLTYLLPHSKKKISTFRTEIPRKPIKFGYFGGFRIIKLDFFEPLHISCHFKTERKKNCQKSIRHNSFPSRSLTIASTLCYDTLYFALV